MSKQERKQPVLTSMCQRGLTSFSEQQSDIMGLRARAMRQALCGSIILAALNSLKEAKNITIQNSVPKSGCLRWYNYNRPLFPASTHRDGRPIAELHDLRGCRAAAAARADLAAHRRAKRRPDAIAVRGNF